jgi:hypothetical protein
MLAGCVSWCGKWNSKLRCDACGKVFAVALAPDGVTGCKQKQNTAKNHLFHFDFGCCLARSAGRRHVRKPKNQRVFNIRRFYVPPYWAEGADIKTLMLNIERKGLCPIAPPGNLGYEGIARRGMRQRPSYRNGWNNSSCFVRSVKSWFLYCSVLLMLL